MIAATIKNSVDHDQQAEQRSGDDAAKLGKEAVATAKLDNESVTSAKLGKGSVTAAKLSDEIGPLLGTLKSGQTLRGVFDVGADGRSELARAQSASSSRCSNAPSRRP